MQRIRPLVTGTTLAYTLFERTFECRSRGCIWQVPRLRHELLLGVPAEPQLRHRVLTAVWQKSSPTPQTFSAKKVMKAPPCAICLGPVACRWRDFTTTSNLKSACFF